MKKAFFSLLFGAMVIGFSSCDDKDVMYKLGTLEQQIASREKENATLQNKLDSLETALENTALIAKQTTGTYLNHDWVDLGTGVLWATCNVGAENPEDFGLYFVWGDTKGYAKYESLDDSWNNYFDNPSKDGKTFITYKNEEGGLTKLKPEHDAATQNWGGKWRMPTIDEFEALSKICFSKWTERNGVKGSLLTSVKNGQSIFLPETDALIDGGAGYWSRSLYDIEDEDDDGAWAFGSCIMYKGPFFRYYEMSVRPVLDK